MIIKDQILVGMVIGGVLLNVMNYCSPMNSGCAVSVVNQLQNYDDVSKLGTQHTYPEYYSQNLHTNTFASAGTVSRI